MTSDLLEMLTYCRPAGSRTETQFRRRYLLNLPGAYVDTFRNIHVQVGDARVLWSCHTDTVHWKGGRQGVQVTGTLAHLPWGTRSSCLGADDTVGVYLLREMIQRRVPGRYLFHFGEEVGGIGSSSLAAEYGDWLREQFDCAIALDRAGVGDIVTHQSHGRTCSDAFAASLGAAMGQLDRGLRYAGAHGVYTDTAEYAAAIPECSNLSVGYNRQHGKEEYVDLAHVDRLLQVLCDLDTARLTIARDPDVRERGEFVEADWKWLLSDEVPDSDVSPDDYARLSVTEREYLYNLDR